MADSKFTADEIVKGLECLNNKHIRFCSCCPFGKYCREQEGEKRNCRHIILDEAVDLIKAKQEVAREILSFVVAEMSKYANDITLSDVIRNLMTEVMTDILNHIDKKYIGE